MASGSIIIPQPRSSSSSPPSPIDAVIFFGFCLLFGILSQRFLSRTRLSYTVILLIIGTIIGSIEYGTSLDLGKFGHGIRIWAAIDPDLLLAVFLPVLLFDSAFSMEPAHIKGCMVQILLLAVPGVVISTFCMGSALKLTFPYNWSWKTSLLLGGLLSATDPVAVLALLKELGGSKKLSTIIEGESMMNDGIAIVLYQLFLQMVLQESNNAGAVISFLAKNTFGAVGIGLLFGIASVLGLAYISNDTEMEMALTLGVSYVAYFTAQVGADVSGILTVMSLGMFCAIAAKIAFKGDRLEGMHNFWGLVAYIANTVVFILSGVLIRKVFWAETMLFIAMGLVSSGDSDVTSTVIDESDAEGEDARAFLEKVRVTFPQVLHVVNMRQVTYSVLNHLMDYFQNLEKVGLLEETEIVHLQDAIQTDWKRLLRNPPLVEMPKINDIMGSLPSPICERIVASCTEIIKPHGVPLYEEGANPTGVWFICNGGVKCSTESLRSRYSDHATFIHGSTLGLYEVLVGRPYISNMITDTTIRCLFVESEKILSAQTTSPAVEDFLWQESAIVLAKLLLPRIFERMSMRDLRALVAERSMMTTYTRGETIRLSHTSVGILLDGTITVHGFGELITSPAALFSSDGNSQSALGMHEPSGTKVVNSWTQYKVEALTRLIIFDIGALEAYSALERGSSSSSSVIKQNEPSMRWPYKQRKQIWRHTNYDGTINKLAIRAMQLSIFVTLVDAPGHNNDVPSDGTTAAPSEDEADDLIVRIDSHLRHRPS